MFGARFKGPSLYVLYQKGNLIRIKTGLDTYLTRIQTRTPLSQYPPYPEDAMGGGERRGGWKTSRMTPLPKGVLDPPRMVRFPPPSAVSALFFLYKNPRQRRPEALLEGSKNFRESMFSGTFSSPHTFCTPPYHGPTYYFSKLDWGLANGKK